MDMLAGYDARNPKALVRLVAACTQLSVLRPEIPKALRTAMLLRPEGTPVLEHALELLAFRGLLVQDLLERTV